MGVGDGEVECEEEGPMLNIYCFHLRGSERLLLGVFLYF